MDASFEISRKLNHLHIQAALKRQDPKTGFVYFDEAHPFDLQTKLIPVLENIAFCLALFNQKAAESFQLGEKLLRKLLCFFSEGNFPRYLHEFPDQNNQYVSIWVYPYLKKIHEKYKGFLQKDLALKISSILESIQSYCATIAPYHHLQPLCDAVLGKEIKEVSLTWESALAYAIAAPDNWPDKPIFQDIKFLENGHLMLSVFDFIKCHHDGFYPSFYLADHPHHLKLSLFLEPQAKESTQKKLNFSKSFSNGFVWQTHDFEEHVFSHDVCKESVFDEKHLVMKGSLNLHEEFGLYFPKDMEITQMNQKGTYFLKDQPIVIKGHQKIFTILSSANLGLVYEKRKEELYSHSSIALKNFTSGPFEIRLMMS